MDLLGKTRNFLTSGSEMRRSKASALCMAVAILFAGTGSSCAWSADGTSGPSGKAGKTIRHDAEYYILEAQNGETWVSVDTDLDQRLAALQAKYGRPPNIIHIMWDDMSMGEVGIPAINKVRGYKSPNINQMAEEGILFTRMYTEVSCTPSRAASMTGRHPVRNGMYYVGFPMEARGMSGQEVTIAEVLSKAGYRTGFFGKWHLGDLEESYPHNQGFDEAFFSPYNQVLSVYNAQGEAGRAVQGMFDPLLPKDPYNLDSTKSPRGWLLTMEGTKGGESREWGDTTYQTYLKIDPEAQKRTLEFIQKSAAADKPFYVAHWPNMAGFIPVPKPKTTRNAGTLAEAFENNVDPFVGRVMAKLRELGIAENTLVIAMADNGPMVHNPPPGLGMNETIFRGGKDDFWEGGVRVPAFAWWPGTIEAGQIVGDMIHQTDLFTTFARVGGALKHAPRDRIIDGLDQSSLLLNGDTNGRRDYNFIYVGDRLAATIKGDIKRVWEENEGSITPPMYNLAHDTREMFPLMVPLLHYGATFRRMRDRHDALLESYPNYEAPEGVPFTGIVNARPETKALWNGQFDK